MMLIRANVLAKGFSGIRPLVAERLCDLLNRGVTPVVPSQGSVGASGDLAPLAHMALVLIGEGEAEFEGRHRLKGGEALQRAGIEPIVLASKEGISLVNGTQAMLACRRPGTSRCRNACRIGRPDLRHDHRWLARHSARFRSAHSSNPPASPASSKAPRI
jgi:histidine ammonia-lyase